jgi:hypothetical protein
MAAYSQRVHHVGSISDGPTRQSSWYTVIESWNNLKRFIADARIVSRDRPFAAAAAAFASPADTLTHTQLALLRTLHRRPLWATA